MKQMTLRGKSANKQSTLNNSEEQDSLHIKTTTGIYGNLDLRKLNKTINESNDSLKNVPKVMETEVDKEGNKISPIKKAKPKLKNSNPTIVLGKESAKAMKKQNNNSVIAEKIVIKKTDDPKSIKILDTKAKNNNIIKITTKNAMKIVSNDLSKTNSHKSLLSSIKEINESISEHKDDIEHNPKIDSEMLDSDWTMELPKIQYSPNSSLYCKP